MGASSAKEDVHEAIQSLDKGIAPGAFCKVLPDILGGDANMVNAIHADGAGTKTILAYLYWRETGDISVWRGIAQDSLVMNLDDLLCIGATENFLVSSTIGRNKKLVPGEVIKEIIEGTEEFCQTMREMGINLIFGGGETADIGDLVKTIVVDSNFVARFPKNDLIEASKISPGDVIIGLYSFGKSIYEKEENSGIASNGITLARHCLLNRKYSEIYPECLDSNLTGGAGYFGKYLLGDKPLGTSYTLGQLMLSPTRTFAPILKTILQNLPAGAVHGIIHNTGGGQGKAKKFLKNAGLSIHINWAIPPIFHLIKREAEIQWDEMFRTFNCGIRMQIFCKPEWSEVILNIASAYGIGATIVGEVINDPESKITLNQDGQIWNLA